MFVMSIPNDVSFDVRLSDERAREPKGSNKRKKINQTSVCSDTPLEAEVLLKTLSSRPIINPSVRYGNI